FAAVDWAVAAVLAWRKAGERMALFSALTLVTFGGATFTGALDALSHAYPGLWWVVACLDFLGGTSIILLFYLFPDGRFVPRWSRWLAGPWMLLQGDRYFFPDSPFSFQKSPVAALLFVGGIILAVVAQIY